MNPYSYYAGGLGIPYMMGMGGYGASPLPFLFSLCYHAR